MPPSAAQSVLEHIYTEQKEVYQAAIDNLAPQQKLRPVFIHRKPRPERHLWLASALSRRNNDTVAANLLQLWLTSSHKDMLVTFLDTLGIEHDGDGMVENVPPAPPKEELEKAIGKLLETKPVEVVRIYLQAFLSADLEGWEPLEALLREDPRLQLPV